MIFHELETSTNNFSAEKLTWHPDGCSLVCLSRNLSSHSGMRLTLLSSLRAKRGRTFQKSGWSEGDWQKRLLGMLLPHGHHHPSWSDDDWQWRLLRMLLPRSHHNPGLSDNDCRWRLQRMLLPRSHHNPGLSEVDWLSCLQGLLRPNETHSISCCLHR